MTADPSIICNTLGLFGEVDHSSAKRHLQFKKLQFESLSYKVRFKARLSKDKTGGHTKCVTIFTHLSVC